MNTGVATSSSAALPFDDDSWEDLLNFIEEKQVIPVLGPELLTVQTDEGPKNLFMTGSPESWPRGWGVTAAKVCRHRRP